MKADVSHPTVSVITATYNRANVLRYAIASVLASTYTDWELIIVGVECTDENGEVVAAFGDPRIRFTNLDSNRGDQSGPNNAGFALAVGRYIAYLNHDDLFFPDHLESSLRYLTDTGADLVYAPIIAAAWRRPEQLARGDLSFKLIGASASGRYEPYVFAPASSWMLRRELINDLGGWRSARECFTEPSQDFLFRAWKAGKNLRLKPQSTVLVMQSGARKNVYKNREEYENKFYARALREYNNFRQRALSEIALDLAGRAAAPKFQFSVKRLLRKVAYRPALWLGWHPRALRAFFKYGRRGGAVEGLRIIRGLEPSAPLETRSTPNVVNRK